MTQSGGRLLLFCIGLVAVISGITLAKGGLYVDRHEGDTLHLIEIVMRMGEGQWPHLDFSTPLGALNFLPMVVFVWMGFGVGTAIVLGQILFALLVLPAIWWTCVTRISGKAAFLVAAGMIITVLAMIHGEADANVSLSMHYNRWSWVLAAISVLLAAIPSNGRENQSIDGVIIGLSMAFFILGKVTYGVAFAPALLLALVLRRAWLSLIVGVMAVVVVAATAALLGGLEFWVAYIEDLLRVRTSEIRPRAGEDWASLILAPRFLVPNLLLATAVVFLRKGDNPNLGLVLTLLFPAFLYVTYQNYGNDPKWLAILAILLWAGTTTTRSHLLAAFATILISPSLLNMAISPVRHLLLDSNKYQMAFGDNRHADFFVQIVRARRVLERRPVSFNDPAFATLNGTDEQNKLIEFKGEKIGECVQELGLFGIMRAVADDLSAAGLGDGKTVFTADTFGSFWLFGDLEAGQGAAPWYYGDLTGYEAADLVLLPTCPITPRTLRAILADLQEHEEDLREIRRTELYVLYEKL